MVEEVQSAVTMPEMTENQTPLRRTHRKKNRETHNAVERHRKKKINSGINKIGELIPCSPALKQSKNMILDQAYKYISELKRQNDEILLNGGTKEQGEEIVRLRRQLDDLQKENDRFMELLKANDICLHDDPTIHWKRKFKSTKDTMISPNQMQDDVLIYTNGNQLNGSCQQATVQSSPELILSTLKNTTQETCLDIMMPMALPDIGPVANGVPLQTRMSQQEIPECLPAAGTSLNTTSCTTTMSTVLSMLNVSTNSSGPVLVQCPLSSCALTPAPCPTSTSAQIVLECSRARIGRSIPEAAGGCPMANVPGVSSSTCLALPLHLQQMGTICTGVECPSGMTQEIASSQSSESRSARWPTTQCLQNAMALSTCQNPPVLARSLPPTFEAGGMYNSSLMSSGPVASSWTVSCPLSIKACSSDLSNLGAFTCMTFAGNTRTTWTTLQLAGNTVHPVSQVSCSVLPTTLSENVSSRNSLPTSDAGQLVNHLAAIPSASRVSCSAYRQLSQQLPVSLQTSTQPLPLQPILAQPCVPAPPAAKVVSLIPPLQVIQMGHPSGAADPSSPNSQKLIILQPTNPSSSAVVKRAVNSQAQGQQIVIIQAASQNAVSVVPAQASSRVAPTLDASQGACSGVPSTQTVGGKHLVHILPRPVPSPASSWQTSTQQQQTISVNGQLFALQPVKQGGGMHIIQPTTSADPNTNVALNTFGALTSLSQSVSQMAVPRALPLECSQVTSPSTSSGQVIRTPSTTVSSPNSIGLSCASHTSNLLPLKPPHLAPLTSKPKKTQKKLSSKQGLSRKATGPGHKLRTAATCSHSARTNQGSPSELAAEQVSPADGLLPSQHLPLPQLLAAVTTAADSPEQPAPKLPVWAPDPPVSEAAPLCPEHPAEANETPALPAASTASSPRADLVGDEACVPTAAPQGPGEAGAGKDSGSGGLPEEPAPCATSGITSVSQQLESLAAAQHQVCAEARRWAEGKTGGQEAAVLPVSPGQPQPEARPSSGEPKLCPPEPEAAPLSAQRQTESPTSSSSASSRGFSVASLLPDSARQDSAFNASSLTEHGDIVALAARAIFEQESPGKGASPEAAGCDAGAKHQKPPCADKEPCPSLQPDTGLGVEGGSANVQEVVSNLARGRGLAVVSSRTTARERPSAPLVCPPLPATTPAVINQGHGCQLAADLPSASTAYPEQAGLSADYPTVAKPQNGLSLKPSADIRKDATKRNGPADHLISTAKRQKQCPSEAPRLDGKPAMASTLPDHQCERDRPFTSSSSLAPGASAGHSDSLGALLPPANFLGPSPVDTLRAGEAHCGGPTRLQEPAAQLMQQQGLAQTNGVSLAHGHSYYKHPQGQLRERQLYQLQHQLSHVEGPAQAQPHGAPQSRTAQQDVQLQKKRGLVRAGQAPSLPLQHKQHPASGGQARHKGGLQQQHLSHPHFGNTHQEKRCESSAASRNHLMQGLHGPDLLHQDSGRSGQGPGVSSEQVGGHSRIQRLLTSRSLEQQMVSKASSVSRPSDMQCAPHRQERNRISSYSAEALIGKSSSAESRMAMQSPRANLEQSELRTYLDLSMNKPLPVHGLQPKLPLDHCMATDVSALADCPPFKAGVPAQAVGNFDVQSSRGSEMAHRAIQGHGFRFAQGAGADRQARLPYLPIQGISTAGGASLRDSEGSCHQTFMQSLLPPPLGEQLGGGQRQGPEHARSSQCAPAASIEYPCAPAREVVHIRRDGEVQSRDNCELSLGALGPRSISYPNPSSVPDIQSRNSSPSVAAAQKAPLRMSESQGNKCHGNSHISNMHGGVRLAHGAERAHTMPPSSTVGQRARHPAQPSKLRQSERARSGSHRSAEALERSLQLPLSTGGGMILARQQVSTTRIVRFGADSQQVPNENLTSEQHSLSQSFGFPFIAEGGMNPPLNANTPFIPPVTQPGANRTPTLIPVEPQNPLPSFYPPYSPAHPNLSNDLSIPYFSNQIFTSPSTEKASNPFGSILSPPRPVGFPQPSFPLLPDIPARPMANSSSITPHLSNFNLTALFPEIAAAPLTADTPGMPMSPLLPLTNPALTDVSKQHSNRSAHNISHILGHDGSSAV